MTRPQFRSRRRKAAQEIIDVAERYLRGPRLDEDDVSEEALGILIEYQRTIVGALMQRHCWCERCERVVIPVDDAGDALCPHCRLVL